MNGESARGKAGKQIAKSRCTHGLDVFKQEIRKLKAGVMNELNIASATELVKTDYRKASKERNERDQKDHPF